MSAHIIMPARVRKDPVISHRTCGRIAKQFLGEMTDVCAGSQLSRFVVILGCELKTHLQLQANMPKLYEGATEKRFGIGIHTAWLNMLTPISCNMEADSSELIIFGRHFTLLVPVLNRCGSILGLRVQV